MTKSRWIVAGAGALAAVALSTAGALAYSGQPGPPSWAPQTGVPSTEAQQARQQQMIALHEQYGVPLGQPLMLADGTGPHGPGAGAAGMGPADCPYRTAS